MIDPNNVPDVAADEMLARYIVQKSHLRGDLSIKPNAFMPPPDLELSVTRHLLASEADLWSIGKSVAAERGLSLYGRGNIETKVCMDQTLSVRPDPLVAPDNPNHAVVCDWPDEKPKQKNVAQELAAVAKFVAPP